MSGFMLTRLTIRNFKLLEEVDVDLGRSVVFVGPNNSGKTSALQALSLWNLGVRRWHERRAGGSSKARDRVGVSINRKDMFAIPISEANMLWRGRHVRDVLRENGKPSTSNVRIEVVVKGVSAKGPWECGLEFDYANEESIYVRPLRLDDGAKPERMAVPEEAVRSRVAYLPPMSGLAATEYLKHQGEIDLLVGQGQTAEVLRNLCYKISSNPDDASRWERLAQSVRRLFGVELSTPALIPERSEIELQYKTQDGTTLDIASSGRGLQQSLLLLAHVYGNPETALLLDEPDAHLEILRQRETFQLLTDLVEENKSQLICASHSEVVLNEAADKGMVVAFVGRPHRMDRNTSQILKALKDIRFDEYYQAAQMGWVLYLEGSTDLEILKRFAKKLGHAAGRYLERPFVEYVANQPKEAERHFYGLREACPSLEGVALFDRLERPLDHAGPLNTLMWQRREIENYFCTRDVLLRYAEGPEDDDLLGYSEREHRREVMTRCIDKIQDALSTMNKPGPWTPEIKATDEFLDPLFKNYFEQLGLPHLLGKGQYYELARLLHKDEIDPEIVQKLDVIEKAARKAE